MEELIEYVKKTFDEPTLKIIKFMSEAELLVSEMKIDKEKENGQIVNKVSKNIIETNYLRLCDNDPEFKHNIMSEIFLHYLGYTLRDNRANWRIDLNTVTSDLEKKCSYCNIKLKWCPMKVLAYVKKCLRDEKINEQAFFYQLFPKSENNSVNDIEENNIAEKLIYLFDNQSDYHKLCNINIDFKGAEFLINTESIKIVNEEYGKIDYKYLDFEIKNISFIDNMYSYFSDDNGIPGNLDIANMKIKNNFSYMFDKSPVELAIFIKYLCDSKKVNYYRVFNKIYSKLKVKENIAKLAYYKEYMHKVDDVFGKNDTLKNELKGILTYIKNYDRKLELPYLKFDFLVYTTNIKRLDDIVSILNKYFRTYNYLSNKNTMYVDCEMFMRRTKDNYDVIAQLDRLYAENDFLIFYNLENALNINEYRLDTFLSVIPKFYDRNKRSVTILSGEKEVVNKLLEKYDILKNKVLKHYIDIESMDIEDVKQKVHSKLVKVSNISNHTKSRIDEYIEKQYKKFNVNENDFIENVYNDVVFNKFNKMEENDDIKDVNLPVSKKDVKLEETLGKLDKLVGLSEVKYRVKEIIKYLEYQRKIGEQDNINLNMMFKGNAGTGKTTVANLMAEILYGMGVINSNKVVQVTGKDLIGSHLGETAPKTQRIVDSAVGGVLIIDEAQTIMTSKGSADYPAEAIATLCNSMDRYKNKLVIIFSGYKQDMNIFKNKNAGITSRIGFEIEFEDYGTQELVQIFENKLEEKSFTINEEAKKRIIKNIDKARISRSFGNARYIDNLYEKLILAHAFQATDENLKCISVDDIILMEKSSVEDEKTIDDILKELNSLIGLKDIKNVIDGFVSVLEFNKKLNRQNDFNMHMIFKGNAGTGKTTVARLIANIYYNLGYINKNKVTEVQSQDLIGEWLGQTGPKTQAVIDSAIDGVLFIDEAYSLMEHKGSNASYTAEAIATLLKAMEDYKERLVVIFAGYTEEMMQFRDLNPGLKSRIGFELTFTDYSIDELLQIFEKKIKDQELKLDKKSLEKVREVLEEAMKVENFGNGRFVDNMVQKVIIEHAKRMKNEMDEKVLRLITVEDIIDVKAERSKNRIGF